MKIKTRPIKFLSYKVFLFLAIAFCAQVALHHIELKADKSIQDLSSPPNSSYLSILSMGEQSAIAKISLLWLQSFDSQSGVKIRYHELDYHKLTQWLEAIIKLNPKSDYPFLLASQIYTMPPDIDKKMVMLEFVYEKFLQNPNQHWRWLSQCSLIAKHQMDDFDLAIKYAKAIRENATEAPTWARQMEALLLEDIGEYQAAQILLGGIISSNQVKDEKELIFLQNKLSEIEQKAVEK